MCNEHSVAERVLMSIVTEGEVEVKVKLMIKVMKEEEWYNDMEAFMVYRIMISMVFIDTVGS